MKDLIYFIVLLLIAAGIGYGFDALFSLLPKNAAEFFVNPFSVGIRPLGIHASVCGIIGLIVSFGIIKPFLNR